MVHIALVAGEASGDMLGAGLINALKLKLPEATFSGIGGPNMAASGCEILVPTAEISVMGITEVLMQYRRLRALRNGVIKHFIDQPPDIFIAIDAPDFNLYIERKLKQKGIKTVHYVSPTVWAWKEYRLKKIKASTDLMLTLFPFEEKYYRNHDIKVSYVGHSLADIIPLHTDMQQAREELDIQHHRNIVAILPGSRLAEIKQLMRPFLETAKICYQKNNDIEFLIPAANEACAELIQQELALRGKNLPVRLVQGQARTVIGAANVVLVASGTATLEVLLLKRPMVVAYKMSRISYAIIKPLLKIDRVALPNLLADKEMVKEFIQQDVVPQDMAAVILQHLEQGGLSEDMLAQYLDIHKNLRCDADQTAASAVVALLESR